MKNIVYIGYPYQSPHSLIVMYAICLKKYVNVTCSVHCSVRMPLLPPPPRGHAKAFILQSCGMYPQHVLIFTLLWHSPAMRHKKLWQIFSNERNWSHDGKINIDFFFDFLEVFRRFIINIRIEVHCLFVCLFFPFALENERTLVDMFVCKSLRSASHTVAFNVVIWCATNIPICVLPTTNANLLLPLISVFNP